MPPSAGPPARPQATPATLFKTWLVPAIVALLAMRLAFVYLLPEGATRTSGQAAQRSQVYYFYNEATGQVQWEDPGDMPHEDEHGVRYWLLPDGSKTTSDPSVGRYAWIEQYSQELNRPYFFNLETSESTWDRPADLSWRRIPVQEENA